MGMAENTNPTTTRQSGFTEASGWSIEFHTVEQGGCGPVYETTRTLRNGQTRRNWFVVTQVIITKDDNDNVRTVSFYGFPVNRKGELARTSKLAYGTASYDDPEPIQFNSYNRPTYVGQRVDTDNTVKFIAK